MSLYVNYSTGETVCQDEISLKDGKRDWHGKKRLSMIIGNLVQQYDKERGNKILSCGTNLIFAMQADGSKHLRSANFCHERLCPMCQWRRSLRLAVQCNKIYAALTEEGYEHVFVSLTVQNCAAADLIKATDKLYEDARKWQRSALFNRAFKGGYKAFEVTYNKSDDTYHPHMHFLLTVDADYFRKSNENYISHDYLMHWWKDIAGLDYDPSVRIQAIRPKPNQSMTAAAVEMCKYPTKIADALAIKNRAKRIEVMQTIDYALRGRRLINFFGLPQKIRKKLKLEDVENGDLITVDDEKPNTVEDVAKITYVWRFGYYVPMEYIGVDKGEELLRTMQKSLEWQQTEEVEG